MTSSGYTLVIARRFESPVRDTKSPMFVQLLVFPLRYLTRTLWWIPKLYSRGAMIAFVNGA